MDEFPIGAALADGRWRVVEVLRGGPDRGQFRAQGDPEALVSSAPPQQGDRAELVARLKLASPKITPLLWSGSVVGEGVTYDVLVEEQPAGTTLDRWQGSATAARGLAAQLASAVQEAHDRGLVLGGLRPELIFVAGNELSGIAPRGERFMANATQRCYGVPPCFDDIYMAPEQLALRLPGPPADVFSLGAVLARLFTGRPPFAGSSILERMSAAMKGRHIALDAAGDLAPLVSSMMTLDGSERPRIEEVCKALR